MLLEAAAARHQVGDVDGADDGGDARVYVVEHGSAGGVEAEGARSLCR